MPKPKQILCIALSTLFIFVGLSPAYAITPKPRKINTGKAKVQKSGVERKTKLGDVRRNRSVAGRNITRSAQAGRNASRQAAVSTATRSTTHVAPQVVHFQTIGNQTGQVAGHAPTQAQLQAQVQARIEADMSNQIRNSAKNSRGKNGVVQPTPASKKVTQTPAKNTAQSVTPTPAPKEPTPTPQPAAQPSTPQQPVVAQSSARPGNLYGGFGFVFDWLKKRDAKKEAKASLESAQSYGEANPEMWEKEAQKAFQKAQEGGLKGEDLKPYQEEFEKASQARAKAEAEAKAKAEVKLADAQDDLINDFPYSAVDHAESALIHAKEAGLTGEALAPYEQTLAKAKEAHTQAQARAKAEEALAKAEAKAKAEAEAKAEAKAKAEAEAKAKAKAEANAEQYLANAQDYLERDLTYFAIDYAEKALRYAQKAGLTGEALAPYKQTLAQAKAKAKAEPYLANAQDYLKRDLPNFAINYAENALSYAKEAGLTGEDLAPYEQTLAKAKEAHAQAQARAKAEAEAKAKAEAEARAKAKANAKQYLIYAQDYLKRDLTNYAIDYAEKALRYAQKAGLTGEDLAPYEQTLAEAKAKKAKAEAEAKAKAEAIAEAQAKAEAEAKAKAKAKADAKEEAKAKAKQYLADAQDYLEWDRPNSAINYAENALSYAQKAGLTGEALAPYEQALAEAKAKFKAKAKQYLAAAQDYLRRNFLNKAIDVSKDALNLAKGAGLTGEALAPYEQALAEAEARAKAKAKLVEAQNDLERGFITFAIYNAESALNLAKGAGLTGEALAPYEQALAEAKKVKARAKAEAKAKAKAEAEAKAKAEAEAKAKAEAKVNAQQNLADAQNYLENNSLNSALSSSQNALSYAQKAGLTGEALAPYEQTLAKAKEAHAQAQARAKALQLAQAKGAPLNLTNKVERAVFNTLQESRETQITAMQKMNNWLQAILRNNKNTSRSFPFLLDFARREGVVSWEEYELLTGWETPHSTISFYVWKISFYSWNTIYDSINKLLTWVQEEKQFWHDARINYQNPNQTALVETTRTALSELSTRLQEELRHLEGLVIRYHNQPTESLLEKIESLQEQIKQKAAQLEQLTQKVNTIYGNELSVEISQTQEVLQEATRVSQIQNLQTQLEMGEQFAIHLTENAGEKPQARRLNPKKLTAQELKLYNKVQTASARLADWKKAHRGKTPSWGSTDPVEKTLYTLVTSVLSDAEKAGWGDTTLVQKLRKQSGLRKWSSSQQLLEEYKRFRVQNPHRNPNSNDPAEAKLHMAMKNQLNIHRAELETNPLFREMNRLWNTVPLEGEELIHLQAEVYAREAVNDPVVLEAEEMWQKFLKRQQRGQ
ncbi:MAG: hypothetical protein J6Y25_06385 [Elusimicrobiaceae bacterium]|nr:hypothetical protein [Elusimicrobiaceae bacterium]